MCLYACIQTHDLLYAELGGPEYQSVDLLSSMHVMNCSLTFLVKVFEHPGYSHLNPASPAPAEPCLPLPLESPETG